MAERTIVESGDQVHQSRTIERLVNGLATSDGAGVKLTRVLTQSLQHRLDPFLMLDAFLSDDPGDYIAGFPDHPHRGFETVTYMIAGNLRHRDNKGHEGLLQNGGVQWMTAGRGIIHSEMPEQENGRMEGFQLWLNLPAEDKMCPAWYRDIPAEDLPGFVTHGGVEVTVIAGESHGIRGAEVRERTAPLYLDISLPAGQLLEQALPPEHNAFIYVYRGEVQVGTTSVPERKMGILSNDGPSDGVVIKSLIGARALLIAGKPLNEPIAQHGPFVMNNQQQLYEAVADYQNGKF